MTSNIMPEIRITVGRPFPTEWVALCSATRRYFRRFRSVIETQNLQIRFEVMCQNKAIRLQNPDNFGNGLVSTLLAEFRVPKDPTRKYPA